MKQDLFQKQKGTEKGLTMSFGNVFWWFSQKNQKLCENNNASGTQCFNCLYLDRTQYFTQISRIVNFAETIENQSYF